MTFLEMRVHNDKSFLQIILLSCT